MQVRKNMLWNVPVYCLAVSWLSYWLTILLGRYIYVVRTVGADGVINASIDPVRSTVFNALLFLAFLLIGGLWTFRGMTRKEIALSAGIISGIYLVVVLLQIYVPGFPVSLSITLAKYQNWTSILYSLAFQALGPSMFLQIASCFAPMLFVLFGRKTAE